MDSISSAASSSISAGPDSKSMTAQEDSKEGATDRLAIGRQSDGRTIKDQFIVTSYRIYIEQGAIHFLYHSAEEFLSLVLFLVVPGAGREINQKISLLGADFFQRVAAMQFLVEVPDVFADRDRTFFTQVKEG